jgi:hypothetical protein
MLLNVKILVNSLGHSEVRLNTRNEKVAGSIPAGGSQKEKAPRIEMWGAFSFGLRK